MWCLPAVPRRSSRAARFPSLRYDEVACDAHTICMSEPLDAQATKQLVNLLTAPLDAYDVVSVLSLSSYPKLLDVLEHNTRKQMAVTIVRSVLKSGTIVQEVEQARPCQQRQFTQASD